MLVRPLCKRIPIKGRGYSLAYQTCGPLMCNMYTLICQQTNEAVIIDPSVYDSEELDRMESHLKGATVKHILLTHGHSDHVAGIPHVMNKWPDASLHLHPLEYHDNYQQASEQASMFGFSLTGDLPEPTHELVDGAVITAGETIQLQVVHTPGHAPGHVAFVDDRPTDDSDGAVIINGDLLFRGSVGRTDFYNCSLEDLLASLRRLNELYSEESIVLSGHTTATKLKTEKESNPFVREALQRPAEWYQECQQRLGWM